MNIAYYCLHKLKILPSQLERLSLREKAFIVAAVEIKLEKDRKAAKEAGRQAGKGRR